MSKKRKIVFAGAGHVGSHGAYALISGNLADEIIFIDKDVKKAEAQATDLNDATAYLPVRTIVRSGTYKDASDADIFIIAVGPLPVKGQTDRMQTLKSNIECIDDVIRGIKSSNFNGIIINISNPADVVTHYIAHRLSWPKKRILSTSTTLDSARVRRALAFALNIDQKSILAYALAEHGESQFVPWSTVTVAGKSLSSYIKEKHLNLDLESIANDARSTGWNILWGKGSTEFGIGASIAEVVRAILSDEHRILPVSTYLDGEYGVKDTFASVPAILSREGVSEVIELDLSEEEKKKFSSSCETMNKNYLTALSFQEDK